MGSATLSRPFGLYVPPKFKILSGKFKRRFVWEVQNWGKAISNNFTAISLNSSIRSGCLLKLVTITQHPIAYQMSTLQGTQQLFCSI